MKSIRLFSYGGVTALSLLFAFAAPQSVRAGSATWNLNPSSGDWNTATNWTPNTVPNGPADVATFAASNITAVSNTAAIEVAGIVFLPAAGTYTITANHPTTISQDGIANSSGLVQNFICPEEAGLEDSLLFKNSATAGELTSYTVTGGLIEFFDTSTAGESTVILNGGAGRRAAGGSVLFTDSATAGDATLVATGGTDGGRGGSIQFIRQGGGGTARVQVFSNGSLDISGHARRLLGVTIGSLEGDGSVNLGSETLSVGANGLSTEFSGVITGFEGGLIKLGAGTLTLSSENFYNGTTIEGGTLRVKNSTGSATGFSDVQINAGSLGGGGTIGGAVIVGDGSGTGAFLAPGKGASNPTTLTMLGELLFNPGGTYTYKVNTKRAKADKVVTNPVFIQGGSFFSILAVGSAPIPVGTVFTAISNTSIAPINGTFSNLADGAIVAAGGNRFQANYEGGDGNDLTLTVVP